MEKYQSSREAGLVQPTRNAALITSGILSAVSPPTADPLAHAVVFKEPLGVVLGIAPWNSPLILGLRAVVAAVATGNTAILKVSDKTAGRTAFTTKLDQD
ncbi:hypothetical protein MCOR25_007921 [Pyricularia grisea]|nr:hypothetical protein MCOR25_007921 [Pyricularia grisea]